MAHPDTTWPLASGPVYKLFLRSDGKFLGSGRNVALTASLRLAEEGYGEGTNFVVRFVDPKVPSLSGTL